MSVCPSCGFRNPGSDPFCRNPACGAFLGWGEEQAVGDQDDTQPFDTEAEARRPDSPGEARATGSTEAGSTGTRPPGVLSALGTSAAVPPRRPTPPSGPPAAPASPTDTTPTPNGTTPTEMGASSRPFPPASWFGQDEPWGRPAPADPWRESEATAREDDRPELPPHTGQPPAPEPYSSFPSEAQLLRRPPLWERMLRRLPVPLPWEGPLRKAPSVRHRERQRALLRFGALVGVIVLIGGGLWLAAGRNRSATTGAGPGGAATGTNLVRVRPTGVVASTESGSRLASNVIDGKLGTFWSRLAPSPDDQPFLRFSFDHPVELGRLAIAAGASGSQFAKRPRPQDIELRFSDGTSLRTTLADRPGFQTVSFSPRQVDLVRLVILSTYPSSGAQRTSISEIRFYRVKG